MNKFKRKEEEPTHKRLTPIEIDYIIQEVEKLTGIKSNLFFQEQIRDEWIGVDMKLEELIKNLSRALEERVELQSRGMLEYRKLKAETELAELKLAEYKKGVQ